MDYGMVGGKETGAESRFKQWTSMMDGLPSVASQDANMHKNGETLNCCQKYVIRPFYNVTFYYKYLNIIVLFIQQFFIVLFF